MNPPTARRILSIGVDPVLLETRRLLLLSNGYDPASAFPREVDEGLLAKGFDLLVLSVAVGEKDRTRILDLVPTGMGTLVLTSFVKPEELLGLVERSVG